MKSATCRILLVEDDKLDQMAFSRFVESQQLPYDCTIAASYKLAAEILADNHFDLVISDYSLGDGTALDVLKLTGKTPVILITGQGDEAVAVKAWQAGIYDYLIKDLEHNYLKTLPITVENAVRYTKVAEQAQLLSAAVMSTSECIYIADLEDKFIFVNSAFCKTYGYQREEIIGKNANILWIGTTPTVQTRSVFRTSFGAGDAKIGFYHRRKDGSIFPVSISRSIVKDEKQDNIAVVGIVRDITELIQIEDRIRALNERLRQDTRVMS